MANPAWKTILKRWLPALLLSAGLITACSRAEVDTGNNGNPSHSNPASPDDVTGQGDGSSACWSSPAALPSAITDFCLQTPEPLRVEFQTAMDMICKAKRLVNQLRANCGWNGAGTSTDHLRVLESTQPSDPGSDFYYLSAYSMTVAPADFSYPGTLLLVTTNPEAFRKGFEVPGGASIAPAPGGYQQSPLTVARYTFEVNGLAKFAFLGEAQVLRVSDRLVAVFNRAVDDLEGLKARRNLTLVLKLEDGREKLLTVEERLVPDLGQHQIALAKMIKLDKIEMENRHRNSLVTSPPKELREIQY
ncbi:MAG: hypothetical protein RIQ81_2701 [Pseudomonadota bacterium]